MLLAGLTKENLLKDTDGIQYSCSEKQNNFLKATELAGGLDTALDPSFLKRHGTMDTTQVLSGRVQP